MMRSLCFSKSFTALVVLVVILTIVYKSQIENIGSSWIYKKYPGSRRSKIETREVSNCSVNWFSCFLGIAGNDMGMLRDEDSCVQPIRELPIRRTNENSCPIPNLDPFHPEAMAFMKHHEKPLQCKVKERATLKGGILSVSGSDVNFATYRPITRPPNDDFKYILGENTTVGNFTGFPVKDEYIALTMTLRDGRSVTEYLMQAMRRPELVARKKVRTELDLNVLMIGLDTTSNAHAQRKIPKSYAYLKDVLGAYIFTGHSIVGDGTTAQVTVFMAGKGEEEYLGDMRGEPWAKPLDKWDWMFKKAKHHGYVTSYIEDTAPSATLSNRLLGFNQPPADYYPRPFFLALQGVVDKIGNLHCVNSQKTHNYQLDMTRRLYEEYPDRKKFLFNFLDDVCWNNFNSIGLMDDDLLDFMKEFKEKGYLNDTMLMIFGDHGWRAGPFRKTTQGKFEERLPLFTLTFPKSFKDRYPGLAKNLERNTKRLTSWYDVFVTFHHLFDYPRRPELFKHGISLFDEVPTNRSCSDANIPEHWCPCIVWSSIDTNTIHVRLAAQEAVNFMNQFNAKNPISVERCHVLRLGTIKRAEIKTASSNTRPTPGVKQEGCLYQVTFVTEPSNVEYEASVHYINGQYFVSGSVSLLDYYGHQPDCIRAYLPNWRKYCFCKDKYQA